jgi:hypothetical protein
MWLICTREGKRRGRSGGLKFIVGREELKLARLWDERVGGGRGLAPNRSFRKDSTPGTDEKKIRTLRLRQFAGRADHSVQAMIES